MHKLLGKRGAAVKVATAQTGQSPTAVQWTLILHVTANSCNTNIDFPEPKITQRPMAVHASTVVGGPPLMAACAWSAIAGHEHEHTYASCTTSSIAGTIHPAPTASIGHDIGKVPRLNPPSSGCQSDPGHCAVQLSLCILESSTLADRCL